MVPRTRPFTFLAAAACLGMLATFLLVTLRAQPTTPAVAIDADDIGGVVTGPNGPEAGVWVIAETRDLPVRYIKIVVTDDRGRFVVPDLPQASYSVWARGYGLVDSAKTTAAPGAHREPHRHARANAGRGRAATTRPSTGTRCCRSRRPTSSARRAASPQDVTQATLARCAMKSNGCIGCHQLGQLSTRTIPAALGTFASGADALDAARAVGPGRRR